MADKKKDTRKVLHVRTPDDDTHAKIVAKAKAEGFRDTSAYVLYVCLNAVLTVEVKK